MKKTPSYLARSVALFGVVAAVLLTSAPAQATTSYSVSGDVNNDPNVVLTYSTYRPHTAYGSLNFLLQSGASSIRFNFVSQSSGNTVGWGDPMSPVQQYEWPNVLVGNYAFMVQRTASCFIVCTNTTFAGVYTS